MPKRRAPVGGWEGAQELAFGLDEAGQGLLVGGAVDAVASGAEQPGAQLRIGVGEIAELAQRYERTLDVLHPRLHPALLLRVARRAGLDLESVALSALGVGTLHLGVVVASAGDGALGVVDGQASRHAVEPLERTAVTSQPGGDLLVGDDLGVGVTRPGQRHDEDPGAQQLTGARVKDLGTLAEVDLRRLAGVELQDRGHLWVSGLQGCEEAAHRGVRAGEAVAAYQGAVDGGALDALTPPTRDPLAMRFGQRGDRGLRAHRAQVPGKLGVAGQGRGDVEPALRLSGAAKLRHLAPTHQPGTRNGAAGIAQPHASKYLTIFEHLEPPIGHRLLPLNDCAGEGTGGKWWSETSAQRCRSGSIKANIEWLHMGGHRHGPGRSSYSCRFGAGSGRGMAPPDETAFSGSLGRRPEWQRCRQVIARRNGAADVLGRASKGAGGRRVSKEQSAFRSDQRD